MTVVECAYCGRLPLADLEALGDLAWGKHVAEVHPEWPPGVAPEWPPKTALIDGGGPDA